MFKGSHYSDFVMGTMVFQMTSLTIVYSTIYSGEDQRKRQSSASLAFVRGIHRWLVNSPHKGAVTRKMFPFDDIIMLEIHHCQHIVSQISSGILNISTCRAYCELGLAHWPLRDLEVMLQVNVSNLFYKLITCTLPLKLVLGECHRTPLMKSQHWLR